MARTLYKTTYDSNHLLYTNNIPEVNGHKGDMLTLEDVENESEIDVVRFLGKSASKVLISFTGAWSLVPSAVVTINGLKRIVKKNIESADVTIRSWENGPESIELAIQVSSGGGVWNSYSELGELNIHSLSIDTILDGATVQSSLAASKQVNIIFIP